MYVAELVANATVDLPVGKGRQAYLLCVEGALVLGGGSEPLTLHRHDAAEVRADAEKQLLSLTGADGAASLALVLEMAEGAGGRGPGKWPMHLG